MRGSKAKAWTWAYARPGHGPMGGGGAKDHIEKTLHRESSHDPAPSRLVVPYATSSGTLRQCGSPVRYISVEVRYVTSLPDIAWRKHST
eukprot:3734612-Rhodomonas_salina.2